MARVSVNDHGYVRFKCPGCHHSHVLPVGGRAGWAFNGDVDRPTLSPSILARSGCCYEPSWHEQERRAGLDEPCDRDNPDESGISICHTCHSFVTDGRIEFLGDCTHALAGQTVDLPELA